MMGDNEYLITYKKGSIPIGALPIGARVFDPTWGWEYRLGEQYSYELYGDTMPPVEVRPVTWIVVARDHYEGLDSHVTLLSEELIGLLNFDDSTERGYKNVKYGYNHWGKSGTGDANHGLRPWLNSTGIHSGEGFYRAFSESFKNALLTTTVPNREWQHGSAYSTSDNVFTPSSTEMGDKVHFNSYKIGSVYPYFQEAKNAERVARLGGEDWDYWTRSPDSHYGDVVKLVNYFGDFYFHVSSYYDDLGVRPALNLKSGTLVSEISD